MKIEIDSAQRRALRALAHPLNPVAAIASKGLTPNVLGEIERALAAHALIKVKLHGIERAERAALLDEICAHVDCAPVQHIGNMLVLWREKPPVEEKPAPIRHRTVKPQNKKQAAAAQERKRRGRTAGK